MTAGTAQKISNAILSCAAGIASVLFSLAALVYLTMPKVAAAVDSLFAEVRASIENAHALGMYDPATSLPNRLHFRSEADKLMSEVLEGTSSAMLFVDLDRFKLVNDSLGHARGDQLLIMVANRLRVV